MGLITGAVAAYLVGCVPAARFASRMAGERPWAKVAGPLADFAKGYLALLLFAPTPSLGIALAFTALVAGAQWPVSGESGRHGQWAMLGAISQVSPVTVPAWGLLWGIGFVASGYFVVGRAVATALLPLVLGLVAGGPIGWIALPGCVMVIERSREALKAVRAGTEAKHHWNSPR